MNEKIKEYLQENEEVLMEIVNEINSYDGSLDWLEFYENDDDFIENMFKTKRDAVRAVCFGNYNYADDFIKFNGYGNLESYSEYQVIEKMKSYIDDIIDRLFELKDDININDDLKNLLEEGLL